MMKNSLRRQTRSSLFFQMLEELIITLYKYVGERKEDVRYKPPLQHHLAYNKIWTQDLRVETYWFNPCPAQ